MKDVVVIGGGASGLVSAIIAARKGKKVTIIEKNEKLGKKILITGNGKCNYFNANFLPKYFHSNSEELIKNIITKENEEKVLSFFDTLGITPLIKNGYFYPTSEQASTILNALTYETKRLKIEILNMEVTDIIKEDHFIINGTVKAKKVILATGSLATFKDISLAHTYDLALGHTIVSPKPALVQLVGNEPYFKKWNGVRCDAKLSLYEDDKFIKEESGQLQLTDYGISGIVTFNLSRYVARNIDSQNEKIIINFIPWLKEDANTWLQNLIKKTNLPINETLERFLNYKLVDIIIKKSEIKTNDFNKLNNKSFSNLIKNLTNFELNITSTKSFDKAQTCSGGIPLTEINLNTMESLKTKDLYLTGEIIDIDGDCGGYNLGFAWISGIVAGENI